MRPAQVQFSFDTHGENPYAGIKAMNWRYFILLAVLSAVAMPALSAGVGKEATSFHKDIAPLLRQYCFACHGNGKHKGDVSLDAWKDEASALGERKLWEKVLQKIASREMPPDDEPQPGRRERARLASWIERDVLNCDCDHPDPGRVTLRRLNRAEYNNTIRDLLGVDFQPAEDFPVDDSGYGFDNIGDALSVPPVLLEKYLAASERILDSALDLHRLAAPRTNRYPVDLLEVGYNAKQRGDGWVALNSIEEDDVAVNYQAPVAGEYAVRVHAYARQDSTNAIKLTFMLDKQPVKVVEIDTNSVAPAIYEARVRIAAGRQRLRAVVRRMKDGMPEAEAVKWKSGPQQKGAVFVEHLEVEGPLDLATRPHSETHRRIFFQQPMPGRETEAAHTILERFARRAYRRPVASNEIARLVQLAEVARNRCAESHSSVAADVRRLTTSGQVGKRESEKVGSSSGAPSGSHSLTFSPALQPAESQSLLTSAATGDTDCFEDGIRIALQAVLVSPHFLFRGELQPEPNNPRTVHPIDEFALASRLSYFLWSSMPDDELFALAELGKLRKNLDRQVRRMLQDPKSRALVDNFAGQWLQLRNVDLVTPDPEAFPAFDDSLRAAMRRETELFFEHIVREDRSVLEFLTADYTFVNERLARHYGLTADTARKERPSVTGAKAGKRESENLPPAHFPAFPLSTNDTRGRLMQERDDAWRRVRPGAPVSSTAREGTQQPDDAWQRVSLRGTPRRGVLTHGSVLLITSNPTRTSPVKRGKWVLDNLLNAPPPPAPPNVPELKDGKELTGTLRQRMEQHRADPLCASCHARMDPFGFGLENFDGIGAWRTKDGGATIDASGKLATGESFGGAADLTGLLAKQKRDQFVRCLADKLLTYALGRGLEYYDKCALDEICERVSRRGYRFSTLVTEIVRSTPFQMRRGDGPAR